MANLTSTSLARQLGALFEGGSLAGVSDRQLLERFTDRDDEAAFAAIVARHGPMVLGLCRQLLGDHHHAEDAFQAAFLVLARQARAIRDPDRLGPWLYGVAIRTARKARGRIDRLRRTEERGAVGRAEARPSVQAEQVIDREQAEALHVEVERLPEPFRLAVVSCYFEGLSPDEAAARLNWSSGTLRSRLARAREKLRVGLERRGVSLPAVSLSPVSPLLCEATARAAISVAARSALASALAREVLRSMMIQKLKLVTMTALALAAMTGGAGLWARSSAIGQEPAKGRMSAAEAGRKAPETARPPDRNPARIIVDGRVLDPDGKPVPGAFVNVVTADRAPRIGASEETSYLLLVGGGQADRDGRFRLDLPRPALSLDWELFAVAAAPGYGAVGANLTPDVEQDGVVMKLRPEEIVRARLVDINGAPARGVEVRVIAFGDPDGKEYDGSGMIGPDPPPGVWGWPRPVTSDDQGRIVLRGIGRHCLVNLDVRDRRFARQELTIDPRKENPSREATLVLQPARLIEGRVLADDTGRPIPRAIVAATTEIRDEHRAGGFTTKFRADEQGRFLINPNAGETYTLHAYPTGGEPYLVPQDELKWTKGAIRATHEIRLPRGVVLRGKVVKRGTGRPLPGSSIQFIPTRDIDGVLSGWQAMVASGSDGSFAVAVPPGKGHLLVFGPTDDYILEVIGSHRLYERGPGGQRWRAHAIIPYEARADLPMPEITAALRLGVTLKGHAEGPDGRPIAMGLILTTLANERGDLTWEGHRPLPIFKGRFELPGLDPERPARISLLDYEYGWGATVEVPGKPAGREPTIRLEPCGKAQARFVGPGGKPLPGQQVLLEFVATPGPSQYSGSPRDQAVLAADSDLIVSLDPEHYPDLPTTDAEGRVTLPALIPGALYRISDESTINSAKGQVVRRDFTVKPGETLDLGDILIENP